MEPTAVYLVTSTGQVVDLVAELQSIRDHLEVIKGLVVFAGAAVVGAIAALGWWQNWTRGF